MKQLTIKLSDRQVYALTKAGISSPSKRKQFGAFGLGKIISDQLMEQLTVQEVEALKEEWQSLKSELPASTPKKVKQNPLAEKKTEYITKDF